MPEHREHPEHAAHHHVDEARAFFGPRAADWDARFHDDGAVYLEAAKDLAPVAGGVVLDLGCGTGRALPLLRSVAGRDATVIGIDVTVEMIVAARDAGRHRAASLVLADVLCLPVRAHTVHAIFTAGLVEHVPEPAVLLSELARVARPGARLAVFHPLGRAALAARHGRTLDPDDMMEPAKLRTLLAPAGWEMERVDDASERFLAVARLDRAPT